MTPTTLLKPSEVSARIQRTTGRVYQEISSGNLPHVRLGRSVRVPAFALEEYIAKKRLEAAARWTA